MRNWERITYRPSRNRVERFVNRRSFLSRFFSSSGLWRRLLDGCGGNYVSCSTRLSGNRSCRSNFQRRRTGWLVSCLLLAQGWSDGDFGTGRGA